jgi:hypothetical protein
MKKLFSVFALCALAARLVTACPTEGEYPNNDDVRGTWSGPNHQIRLKGDNSWSLHGHGEGDNITARGGLFIYDGDKKLTLTIEEIRDGVHIEPVTVELKLSSVNFNSGTIVINASDNPQLEVDVGEFDTLLSTLMAGSWVRQ